MSDFDNTNQNLNPNPTPRNETKKKNPFLASFAMLLVGGIIVGINLSLINSSQKFYPKFTVIGMLLLFLGVAVLIAPGAKEVDSSISENKFYNELASADVFTRIIWILYMIASFAATFYICIFAKTWGQILAVFIGLAVVSGFLYAVKYLIILAKGKYPSDPNEADYFTPSKSFAVIGLMIGLAVTGVGAFEFYQKIILEKFDHPHKEKEETAKVYLEEHFDDYVPIRIMSFDGEIVAVIDTDTVESEDSEEAQIKVRLKDLIDAISRTLSSRNINASHRGIEYIGLLEGDNLYTFNYDVVKNHEKVKEWKSSNEESESIQLFVINHDEKVKEFIKEYYDSFVIVKNDLHYHECAMIWDIHSFAEFYNSLNKLSEENAYTGEELLFEIVKGNLKDSVYTVTGLSNILSSMYKEENSPYKNVDLLINFGSKTCLYSPAVKSSMDFDIITYKKENK